MGNKSPHVVERSWGVHSIITFDGTPFVVFQKWELWYTYGTHNGGRTALAPMPSAEVDLVPLENVVQPGAKKRVAKYATSQDSSNSEDK